jgi:hypothetical protein
MPFYNQSARKAIADTRLGMRVDRATATLPQTTASALFNVVGGAVAITAILGEVTTIIQNQANNTKLTANPTTGTSVDICTVLDIANDEVATLYSVSTFVTGALVGGTAGAALMPDAPVAVNIGTIDLDCAASNTGAIKWSIWYVPLEDGAYIEAA